MKRDSLDLDSLADFAVSPRDGGDGTVELEGQRVLFFNGPSCCNVCGIGFATAMRKEPPCSACHGRKVVHRCVTCDRVFHVSFPGCVTDACCVEHQEKEDVHGPINAWFKQQGVARPPADFSGIMNIGGGGDEVIVTLPGGRLAWAALRDQVEEEERVSPYWNVPGRPHAFIRLRLVNVNAFKSEYALIRNTKTRHQRSKGILALLKTHMSRDKRRRFVQEKE